MCIYRNMPVKVREQLVGQSKGGSVPFIHHGDPRASVKVISGGGE